VTVSEVFKFNDGNCPLLVNFPHSGTFIPQDIANKMTPEALEVPDTDFFLEQLYVFLRPKHIPHLIATHSRYVVDLNRPPDDKPLYRGTFGTGLFPEMTFTGKPIYKNGKGVGGAEAKRRMEEYYWPYHNKLAAELEKIKNKFGYALLWDAHSLKSQVPTLFEGKLPDYNFGTNNGEACKINVENKFRSLLYHLGDKKVVFNDRFLKRSSATRLPRQAVRTGYCRCRSTPLIIP